MASTHIDRLVSIIIANDMECVLTRETILVTVEGMKYADAVESLTEWAVRLIENADALMNGEYL